MKAIYIDAPLKLRIADIDVPKPAADQVLLKIISAGICGSDVGIYYGTNSLVTYPRLIGHEYAGEVVEAGADVRNLKPGDVVSVDPVRSCGVCRACRTNRHNVCSSLEVTGVHRDGGFTEYIAVEEAYCYKMELPSLDRKYYCLAEPYSIGVQVNHRGRVAKDDQVLILGSGPIGLCILQAAKRRGAAVTMTDLVDRRLERALSMGADHALNGSDPAYREALLRLTENAEGFDVVIDTVCSVASFPMALDLARPAGRVVTLGLIDRPSEVAQVSITKKELDVVGSRLSNYRFPEVIEGFQSGGFTPEKLCTDIVSYRDTEAAIRRIREQPADVCKIVITFSA